jgi:transcriptional regulator with XRE-family HTH domain
MSWVDRLNRKFEATGWSKMRLAKEAGVPYDSVLKYLGGKVEQPRGDMLDRLARAVGVTALWLEHGLDDTSLTVLDNKSGQIAPIPVIGFVKAGIWQDVREGGPADMFVPSIGGYPVRLQKAYIVDGESLNKIARPGDVLICLDLIGSAVSIVENDLVIVEMTKHEGEFVDRSAKRVRKTKTGYELWPESDHPDHQEPIVLEEADDGTEFRISAKVLWIIRKP